MAGKKAEQSRRTRAGLVEVARDLFAARGFADTSTDQIIAATGVTRGALYHHFRDKADLFAAVCEQLHAEAAAAIETVTEPMVAAGADPFDIVVAGCEAWIDSIARPQTRRLLLIEAPTVLGWARWQEMDDSYGSGLLHDGIIEAQARGRLTALPASELAMWLNGAINQAVVASLGRGGDNADAAHLKASLRTILARLD